MDKEKGPKNLYSLARGKFWGRNNIVGRGLGTQTWALHPVVRGSIPLRSTKKYIKLFGGAQ